MKECEHKFVFIRQEKENIGYERNPTYLYQDVYFCERCLEYKKVKIRETRPSRESFYVEDTIRTY